MIVKPVLFDHRLPGATFCIGFIALFDLEPKKTLVFIAKVSRAQICAYYSSFSGNVGDLRLL